MNCKPTECYTLNERIAIKADSEVINGDRQAIRETCARCEFRKGKTSAKIQAELNNERQGELI